MDPDKRRLNLRVPSHEDEAMAEVMAAPLGTQLARFEDWGLPRTGLLILMSACQGRCFFCASPAVTDPGPDIVTPFERVERWLDDNLELGVEDLCLGGTEPPTHTHFDATLERAKSVGFSRIQLMTSGLSLESSKLAADWYAAGIRSICVPLYGSNARAHDSVVGVPGHFERATRGLDNARSAGIEPFVHTLLLRRTLGDLGALATLTRSRWGARLAIAPLRAKDEVFAFRSESVPYDEIEPAIASADVSLVGFPSCVAPEVSRGGPLLIELYFRAQKMVFDAACEPCTLRESCPGLVAAHHEQYGAAGLRPTP